MKLFQLEYECANCKVVQAVSLTEKDLKSAITAYEQMNPKELCHFCEAVLEKIQEIGVDAVNVANEVLAPLIVTKLDLLLTQLKIRFEDYKLMGAASAGGELHFVYTRKIGLYEEPCVALLNHAEELAKKYEQTIF